MPTKKDYLAISTILRNNRPNVGQNTLRYKTWWRIREDIIAYLVDENPQFDSHRFREHTEFNKNWADNMNKFKNLVNWEKNK